jgi:hypothetical protein
MRPGWIDRGIRILDSDPQVGVIYGDAQCFGQRSDRWLVGPFATDQLLRWNYIHASALYRRSVWEQNRGYDGTMPVQGFEDWDFWIGALKHGWQFAYVPEVFFDYRIAKESMITRAQEFKERVVEFVAIKHGPLYRHAWLELAHLQESQHESLRWTFRNLRRLLNGRNLRRLFRARIHVIRATVRVGLWHPMLNATRPVRHVLGLRQENIRPPLKK